MHPHPTQNVLRGKNLLRQKHRKLLPILKMWLIEMPKGEGGAREALWAQLRCLCSVSLGFGMAVAYLLIDTLCSMCDGLMREA